MARVVIEDRRKQYDRIVKQFTGLNNLSSKVGLFGEGDSPENNIAARGVVNEFPTPKENPTNPERPFMRNGFDNNLINFDKVNGQAFQEVMMGIRSGTNMVKKVSEAMVGFIKDELTQGNFAQLKASTIAKKGSSKPLIDSAEMRNSLTYKLKKGLA